MCNIRLQVLKLARKCESKHWFPCGGDGWSLARSVYGHLNREFKIPRLRTTTTVKHATAHDQNHVTLFFPRSPAATVSC